VPADSASQIVKFTISIPRESCTNAKARHSSSVVLPDPSVHFYHCLSVYQLRPCIRPGWLNRVLVSAGVRAGMSHLPGGR